MIQNYAFGKMVVNDTPYNRDLIIAGNRVIPEWWRKKGHQLQLADIRDVLDEYQPETLVVGQGKLAMMKVTFEVQDYLNEKNITLFAANSEKAVQQFNHLHKAGKNIAGAFHLTC